MASTSTSTYNEAEELRKLVLPARDGLFSYNEGRINAALEISNASSFEKKYSEVYISSSALLKMVEHADEGGPNEVMGIMTGYVTSIPSYVSEHRDRIGPIPSSTAAAARPTEKVGLTDGGVPSTPDGSARMMKMLQSRIGQISQQSGMLQSPFTPPSAAAKTGSGGGGPADDVFVVTDSFRLPVKGTETRVNASEAANESLLQYLHAAQEGAQPENAVGWYHSHPGYGCWLSGIDVETQRNSQRGGPWVAVVIDPVRTLAAGKVDIGAFRTVRPEAVFDDFDRRIRSRRGGASGSGGAGGGKAAEVAGSLLHMRPKVPDNLPYSKIPDYSRHANEYYPLLVHVYKSHLEAGVVLPMLGQQNWINTLSETDLLSAAEHVSDTVHGLMARAAPAAQSLRSRNVATRMVRGPASGHDDPGDDPDRQAAQKARLNSHIQRGPNPPLKVLGPNSDLADSFGLVDELSQKLARIGRSLALQEALYTGKREDEEMREE